MKRKTRRRRRKTVTEISVLFISGRGKARANKRKSVNRQELARSLRLVDLDDIFGKKSVSRSSIDRDTVRVFVCMYATLCVCPRKGTGRKSILCECVKIRSLWI